MLFRSQVANLALGAIGIGVSVAGLAVLSAKISRIESRMDDISIDLDRLAKGVESLRQDRIAEDFTRLRTTGEMMDEAWRLSDPGPQWRLVATEAHAIANTFERRACELLDQGQELATVDPFLEGLALAASTRVAARLAAGDDVVGSRAAEEGARALIKLGQRLQLSGATLREMRDGPVQPASPEWGRALDGTADRLKPAFAALRDREAAAASTVLTVRELGRQGIRGRAWLAAAREEEESPLLCLVPAET